MSECSICCSDYEEVDDYPITTICNHTFHSRCISDWYKINRNCPNCRCDEPIPVLDTIVSSQSGSNNSTLTVYVAYKKTDIGKTAGQRLIATFDVKKSCYNTELYYKINTELGVILENFPQPRPFKFDIYIYKKILPQRPTFLLNNGDFKLRSKTNVFIYMDE